MRAMCGAIIVGPEPLISSENAHNTSRNPTSQKFAVQRGFRNPMRCGADASPVLGRFISTEDGRVLPPIGHCEVYDGPQCYPSYGVAGK